MEIGIIGAGWWAARTYIPLLQADQRVGSIAVCRPDREGLETLARELGTRHGFTDASEMLARRPLAGVIVSSPHPLHVEHAMMCLDRRLPVLVEKPMATTATDARMLAGAVPDDVPLIVAYGWNFGPVAAAARRLVEEGRIGELVHATCQMATPTLELFSGRDQPTTAGHVFRPPASTWADPKRAGGFAWGQLTHGLGLFFLLVDLAPAKVFSMHRLSGVGVDHSEAAVVELENGATVSLSGSALLPPGSRRQVDIRLFGSEGTLLLDTERDRLEVTRFDGETHVENLPPGAGDYRVDELVDAFVSSCSGRAVSNLADARVGLRAVEVIDAMHRSVDSGAVEEIRARAAS